MRRVMLLPVNLRAEDIQRQVIIAPRPLDRLGISEGSQTGRGLTSTTDTATAKADADEDERGDYR